MDKEQRKCLLCGKKLKGKRKKFCCNKHKDRYHNVHNPRGIYAFLQNDGNDTVEDIEDSMHPQDPYSLGQE